MTSKPLAQKSHSYLWLGVIPILLFIFWFAARSLDMDILFTDEFYSVSHVIHEAEPVPPLEILDSLALRSPQHSPGYFILLRLWVGITGQTVSGMRLLALFIGLLGICWTFRLGRDLATPAVGLIAAILIAGSAIYVDYLHAIRMYSLLVALCAFTFWIYFRIMAKPTRPTPLEWVAFFLGAAGLLYTHIFAIFPLAAIAIDLAVRLVGRWRRDGLTLHPKYMGRFWGVALAGILAGLSFLPWVGVITRGATVIAAFTEKIDPASAMLLGGRLFGNGQPILFIALLLLALYGMVVGKRAARQTFWVTILMLALLLGLNELKPLVTSTRSRYFLILIPTLAVFIASGLAVSRIWSLMTAGLLALYVGIGIHYAGSDDFKDYNSAGRDVGDNLPAALLQAELMPLVQPNDFLLVISWSPQLYRYLPRFDGIIGQVYLEPLSIDFDMSGPYVEDEAQFDDIHKRTRALTEQYHTIWLVYQPFKTPPVITLLRQALGASRTLCAVVHDEDNLRIEQYAALDACAESLRPTFDRIRFLDDIITLEDIILSAQSDGNILLEANWTIQPNVPPEIYSVSFQLFDATGEKVAQSDYGLEASFYDMERTSLPAAELPPGIYELRMSIYNWRTLEQLTGASESGGEQSDNFIVSQIELTD
jgi:hypothetical protein